MNYICIHGHFYQPPRENPWLEDIEVQDSAYPYHDWNERITAECYAPNAASRILDSSGKISKIPNNYAEISFNFGPTLLAWLEQKSPEVYASILLADKLSQQQFSGHGSALAQCYNHIIMPLAHPRDKYTQVLWGIRDFQHRFGRDPEGMWLPETAVDLETLDIMAELGIKFTILAPRQASRVRPLDQDDWDHVSGERLDPTRAYVQRLPSGRSIALFFYDGPISKAVAFEGLLNQGEHLAERLLSAISDSRQWPQLIHIATDGETFGHHHHHGEMALSYALKYIRSIPEVRLTNYGEYLEKHPPEMEVEIFENSSWSCVHGVERWWRDCGCNSGLHPGWGQSWRQPLRQALDWLRDKLAVHYEAQAAAYLHDPWAARNDYLSVINNRSHDNIQAFLSQHARQELDREKMTFVLRLLEIQRCALLMYTSCGWFFDELSGLETVQVIQYAGRALQIAKEVFPEELEENFLQLLAEAKSNLPELRDGRRIYEKFVRPAMVDILEVGAHYAISSPFENYGDRDSIFCYDVIRQDYRRSEAGRATLAIGRIEVSSKITLNSGVISFAVIHLGDHNIYSGVRFFQGRTAYDQMTREITEVFAKGGFPETIRLMDHHFGTSTFSLRSIFRDEKRKILQEVMASSLQEVGAAYQQIFKNHVPLMRFLADLNIPLPKGLLISAEMVINLGLRHAFEAQEPDLDLIASLLEEAKLFGVDLDAQTLEFTLRQTLQRLARALNEDPARSDHLRQLDALLALVTALPFEINVWTVQNICYDLLHRVYPEQVRTAAQGSAESQAWVALFMSLIEKLNLAVP